MRKRGAPYRPSSEPYIPSRNDGVTMAPCLLCGDEINGYASSRVRLVSQLEDTQGQAHKSCQIEYAKYAAQFPGAAALETPPL